MPGYLVDANIYLNFYRDPGNLAKLAKILLNHKDDIFVSTQIIDEDRRNKGDMARDFLAGHFKKILGHLACLRP